MKEKLTFGLFASILAALVLTACGTAGGGDYGGKPPNYSSLQKAPQPLLSLYKQPNALLDGGLDGLDARVASMKGHGVVVNLWGSWCGPCREEFPYFQQAVAKLGKKVAFIGVNTDDTDDSAKQFLSEYPIPYPSYVDPDSDVKTDYKAQGLPTTAFYTPDGERSFVKVGQYASLEDLEADIENYTSDPER
jgi:cytochrome c biogenesis protein CcmG/thiol:disulfide interchange protein DsbE